MWDAGNRQVYHYSFSESSSCDRQGYEYDLGSVGYKSRAKIFGRLDRGSDRYNFCYIRTFAGRVSSLDDSPWSRIVSEHGCFNFVWRIFAKQNQRSQSKWRTCFRAAIAFSTLNVCRTRYGIRPAGNFFLSICKLKKTICLSNDASSPVLIPGRIRVS